MRMPFWYTTFGDAPEAGHSLWISMHGGGGAPPEVNTGQWENQKKLYQLEEGIYVAPRAPTDTWNLWHQSHIDPMFDRLIENMIAIEGVDPNRVYITGYSAGGDGVYQLAPRMADRWAGAGMMAGHPNETKPDGLRNTAFTLHMGAKDAAFKRNQVAGQWKAQLAKLKKDDPAGYDHWVEIHEGKSHWMDRQEVSGLHWMASKTRKPRPKKIVWLQDEVVHPRFYWLANDDPQPRQRIVAQLENQTVHILEAGDASSLRIRLDDGMVDLDRKVIVRGPENQVLFQGQVPRTIETMAKTLAERGDPTGIFTGEIVVELPTQPSP
jgi:predicted esterase